VLNKYIINSKIYNTALYNITNKIILNLLSFIIFYKHN